jgi:hypothetical protein
MDSPPSAHRRSLATISSPPSTRCHWPPSTDCHPLPAIHSPPCTGRQCSRRHPVTTIHSLPTTRHQQLAAIYSPPGGDRPAGQGEPPRAACRLTEVGTDGVRDWTVYNRVVI